MSGTGRRRKTAIVLVIIACVMAVGVVSCDRKDLAVLIMIVAGIEDRRAMRADQESPSCDGSAQSQCLADGD